MFFIIFKVFHKDLGSPLNFFQHKMTSKILIEKSPKGNRETKKDR